MKLSTNLMALAAGGVLLACSFPRHEDAAAQLNKLQGPTRDWPVELREGTNLTVSQIISNHIATGASLKSFHDCAHDERAQ